jgi:Ca2+-binding RTX toxin-like protein
MYTLRNIKNLTIRGILPPLLVMAGLAAINSSAQAACFGYPESTAGCKINGKDGACVGTKATGDIIVAGASFSGCTNPPTSDLDSGTCVIRGLGGPDRITPASSSSGNMMIVCGGGGDDLILGGSDNDVILGEAGKDIIIGEGGTNLIYGGSENDTLLTGAGFSSSNFNYGGTGTSDVCQKGRSGINYPAAECEVKLP